MNAVTRVLPGDWGLSRFLRFLAGLVLIALAFAAPAAAAETPVPVPAVSVSVQAVAAIENPDISRTPVIEPTLIAVLLPAAAIFPRRTRLVGRVPSIRATRAPPLA